ncbi:MAG TPA: amidohydrolase family protein [Thermoplasmata archaeon]|nr:amidohydrolase family protein [Thermoplasmata archaeon]
MGVTDCHIHVNPLWEMRPEARALIDTHPDAGGFETFLHDPRAFLKLLDAAGLDRAVLVNYVAPEIIGYTEKVNEFVRDFVAADPDRLIAVGSVLPSRSHPGAEVRHLVREYGVRGIKLHPPHQLFAPNGYLDGKTEGLREIYAACEELCVPVIVHTGTSIFPGARNRFGQPLLVEDVAIDFPHLTIVLAHGGRPLWMEEAVFLTRRFSNVYLETSSVPPGKLLEYFPALEKIRDRVLYGSDWPGPGVRDLGEHLKVVRSLPLSPETLQKILVENPRKVFPPRGSV